jgi:DNA-binding transcriptional regulator YdaS (Cro superfamily)
MDKYAEALTEAMESAGVSSSKVADVVHVGRNNVAHWRVGRRPIPAEHAPAIAALLGVAPERISKAYDLQLRVQSAQEVVAHLPAADQKAPPGHISIERVNGFSRPDLPYRVCLPEFLVRREIGPTPLSHLRWAVQLSRSMEPEIKRNALVLVDATQTDKGGVVDGGIYIYSLWGRLDIRRVFFRRDVWHLAFGQTLSESATVGPDDQDGLIVLGAVVGWL